MNLNTIMLNSYLDDCEIIKQIFQFSGMCQSLNVIFIYDEFNCNLSFSQYKRNVFSLIREIKEDLNLHLNVFITNNKNGINKIA